MQQSTDENKALIRRVVEDILNGKRMALIDEIFAPDYVDHSPGEDLSRDGFKQFAELLFQAFPDFHVTIDDLLAEGDRVMYRGSVSGTHTGEFMGMHPTGRRFSVMEMHVDRISGGRIVEHWGMMDTMGMLEQLGVVHEPEEPGT